MKRETRAVTGFGACLVRPILRRFENPGAANRTELRYTDGALAEASGRTVRRIRSVECSRDGAGRGNGYVAAKGTRRAPIRQWTDRRAPQLYGRKEL